MNSDIRPAKIKEVLNREGFIIYRTKGISMFPMIREGEDMVRLIPFAGGREPTVGDVVLFERKNGTLVLHRIVSETKDGFDICGDNCIQGEIVKRKQILALMEGYYKGETYIPSDNPAYRKYADEKLAEYGHRTEEIRPMKEIWLQLIELLRCSVTGCVCTAVPAEADWEKLLNLARKHSISATTFPAVDAGRCSPHVFAEWKQDYERNIRRCAMFAYERGVIFDAFAKQGIRYVPLKGLLLADLYPAKELREFADNDILIDACNAEKAREIFASMGYDENLSVVHDAYHKEPLYNFEIHKGLFPETSQAHAFFKDIMSRVVPFEGSTYECRLSDEDFYLHIVAHFYKHFTNGGSGLRSLTDLWLLNRSYRERGIHIDESKLKKLGMLGFAEEMSNLAELLFTSPDKLTYDDISYVMTSGTYGTMTHSIQNGMRKNGKLRFILSRLFPPIGTMKQLFPVLSKVPVLLPFCWIVRLFMRLFSADSRLYLKRLFIIAGKE